MNAVSDGIVYVQSPLRYKQRRKTVRNEKSYEEKEKLININRIHITTKLIRQFHPFVVYSQPLGLITVTVTVIPSDFLFVVCYI